MCLAIPGKVIEIDPDRQKAMVDFQGITKKVIVALVPKVVEGSYVIVHAGMAIEIVHEERAKESLALWHELMEKDPYYKSDFV